MNKKKNNVRIIACQSTDEEIRKNSSSGGVFSLLAKKILDNKGVVYGAAFTPEFSIRHIRATNEEELSALRTSKYAFSNLGTAFTDCKKDLDEGREVLFTGTPCQVAGLRRFLKNDYDNLLAVDIICHGTPSLASWNQYLKEISNGKKVSSVNFRDKRQGWNEFDMAICWSDGTEYAVHHDDDLYMKAFLSNLSLRNCCYDCHFKGVDTRESDITLGDLWGAAEIAKDLYDDKGTSLLLISSDKGSKAINEIRNHIKIAEVNASKAFEYNFAVNESAKPSIYKPLYDKTIKENKELIPFFKSIFEPTTLQKVRNKLYRGYRRIILRNYPT